MFINKELTPFDKSYSLFDYPGSSLNNLEDDFLPLKMNVNIVRA